MAKQKWKFSKVLYIQKEQYKRGDWMNWGGNRTGELSKKRIRRQNNENDRDQEYKYTEKIK